MVLGFLPPGATSSFANPEIFVVMSLSPQLLPCCYLLRSPFEIKGDEGGSQCSEKPFAQILRFKYKLSMSSANLAADLCASKQVRKLGVQTKRGWAGLLWVNVFFELSRSVFNLC